jgi:phage shock protein PspC (stress-responsive transcriptional regulator)
MKSYQPAARNDTMLGVCQSLGEDFGIHPNILRVAFGVGLIVVPVAVASAYVVLAIVVALNHWLFPKPWPVDADATGEPVEAQPAQPAPAFALEEERLAEAA